MGLYIKACRNIKLIGHAQDVDEFDERYDYKVAAYVASVSMQEFPEHATGLEPNGVYSFDEKFTFEAGSYSGYQEWREWLAETVFGVSARVIWDNPQKYVGQPFVELIDFSPTEGYINASISAKLAKDFADHQAVSDNHPDEMDRQRYNGFRKAFEIASDSGFVDFG